MAFPVEEKYITETESEFSLVFPAKFRARMITMNGGELVTDDFNFELYPFFDKSDKKRISRTCNHIGLETKNAMEWQEFPKNAIAIASDGYGNQVVLLHNGDGTLKEDIFLWNHETGETNKIANSINDFEE
jgi:hypothetical protein